MPQTKEYKGKKSATSPSNKRRPRHELNDEAVEAVQSEETVFDGAEAINTEAQNEGITVEEAQAELEASAAAADAPSQAAYEAAYEEPAPNYEAGGFADSSAASENSDQKVHLDFYGSDLIRMKAPQIMDLADTVADEWVKDGQFQGLPVGNPIAQLAAAKALRTAKDVEKKLEEKGVFVMAKMGLDYLKSKIEKR